MVIQKFSLLNKTKTLALNLEETGKKFKKNIKNFPSGKDDWKKFEKNNLKIALNILHTDNGNLYNNIEKIYPAYILTLTVKNKLFP